MTLHLDTNIVIAMTRLDHAVIKRIRPVPLDAIAISAVVMAELQFGVEKSQRKKETRERLEAAIRGIRIAPFDAAAAAAYGSIRARLAAIGQPIGPNDLLIAATALSRGATILTRNQREFLRVPDLRVEVV